MNAGNANAHTGKDGLKIIDKYVKALTKKIKCRSNEVLVSSTGVIGEKFNPNLIIDKFKKINSKNKKGILESAKAIMTTDTFPKVSIKNIYLANSFIPASIPEIFNSNIIWFINSFNILVD